MSTGLFSTRAASGGGPRKGYRPKNTRASRPPKRDLTRFAELIADGWSISAASRELGIAQQTGSKHFQRMRRELGWQAQ